MIFRPRLFPAKALLRGVPGFFCVHCGKDGPVYGGLCQACYGERHALLTPPEIVNLPRCVHCGRSKLGAAWSDLPLQEAIDAALLSASRLEKAVTAARFTHRTRDEDEVNKRLTVTAALHVEDFDVVRTFETRFRLQGATCPTCSRQRGSYYESIIQLRASTGRLPEDLAEAAVRRIEKAVARNSAAFISKVEKVRGGIDVYLSSGALGKSLAKEFKEDGAETKSAAKIFGQKEGKELYRVTYLVRFLTPGGKATGGRARSRRAS